MKCGLDFLYGGFLLLQVFTQQFGDACCATGLGEDEEGFVHGRRMVFGFQRPCKHDGVHEHVVRLANDGLGFLCQTLGGGRRLPVHFFAQQGETVVQVLNLPPRFSGVTMEKLLEIASHDSIFHVFEHVQGIVFHGQGRAKLVVEDFLKSGEVFKHG